MHCFGEGMLQDYVKILPQFVQRAIYEHDIEHLNFSINTTQTLILMFVNENSEKSMSEISSMTGLEKSSFTRSVDCLVKNGFITRKYPEHDRRKIKLSLTEMGIVAAKLIQDDFDLHLKSLISHFSENEKKEFFESLSVLSGYIRKILEEKPGCAV
jgi:DNA-binding MarR family transcriptional regulator